MGDFSTPTDLSFNRSRLTDPAAFAEEAGASSWLYLCGDEFAQMEGGMSFAQVQAAVPHAANVVSDPPFVLNLDLARQHVAALDDLPRPTVVTCRSGPRASAVVYMYAGLRSGATAEEVLKRAELDRAPFCAFDDYKTWVAECLDELG